MASRFQFAANVAIAGVVALGVASARAASSTEPEKPAAGVIAPDSAFARQPGDLSEKLDKSNGVIRPREVDPAIEKTPQPTGTAAVIVPPGGKQGVQPK